MTNPKTLCCVPGCTRWSRRYPAGWWFICATHYRMVPARVKRRRNLIRRRLNARGESGVMDNLWTPLTDLAWRLEINMSGILKRAAVAAAAGI